MFHRGDVLAGGRRRRARYQAALWQLWQTGRLHLHDLQRTEVQRRPPLMAKYHDIPMDLADASLLVVAESRGLRRIFSIDRDFLIYRLPDGTTLDIIR